MEEDNKEREMATPPYFKSWSSIYLIVIGSLVVTIALIYLFTVSFV